MSSLSEEYELLSKILGINAYEMDIDEVKKVYHDWMRPRHSDKKPNPELENEFKIYNDDINKAIKRIENKEKNFKESLHHKGYPDDNIKANEAKKEFSDFDTQYINGIFSKKRYDAPIQKEDYVTRLYGNNPFTTNDVGEMVTRPKFIGDAYRVAYSYRNSKDDGKRKINNNINIKESDVRILIVNLYNGNISQIDSLQKYIVGSKEHLSVDGYGGLFDYNKVVKTIEQMNELISDKSDGKKSSRNKNSRKRSSGAR